MYLHKERRCGQYLALFEPSPSPQLVVHANPATGDPLGVHLFVIADLHDWPEGIRDLGEAYRRLRSWLDEGFAGVVGGADSLIHPARRVRGQGEFSQLNAFFPKWSDKGTLTAFCTPGGHRPVRAQDLKVFCERFQISVTGELAA